MLCPDDPDRVQAWDGLCNSDQLGFVYCPFAEEGCVDQYIQPGECVDIRLIPMTGEKDVPMKCGWVCDQNGQTIWFTKKGDNINYYTDVTETTEVVPALPLRPATGGGPDFEMATGWVCDEDGTIHYFVKDVVVNEKTGDRTHTITYYTDVSCATPSTPVGTTRPSGPKVLKETIIGSVKIDIPLGSEITLSPIPADATGAEIVFEGEPCCVFRATWDGSDAEDGVAFTDGGCVSIGCTKEAQSDPIELQNFKVIAEDDCTGCMRVSFYKES